MFRGKALVAALAVALLLATSDARASFTYQVTSVPTTQLFGPGNSSTYTITPAPLSAVLAGTQIINLSQMTQSSTRLDPPGPTDTTSFLLTLTTTINNQQGGGSGNIVLTGTINVTRSDTLGAASTYTLSTIAPPTLTLGTFVYAISLPAYTAPTLGSTPSNGGLSVTITERVVPEPASLVMMGTGVMLLGGLSVLRRRRQG